MTDLTTTTPPWKGQAACKGLDPTIFYPSDDADECLDAKAVCAQCPVADLCLEHALGVREKEGIWGGCTERERRRIIRQRRRSA
ncbi:MAG TPA: WhiB family transcriptional regulator [Iamia sp.]